MSYINREALKRVYMQKGMTHGKLRLSTIINELELAPEADVVDAAEVQNLRNQIESARQIIKGLHYQLGERQGHQQGQPEIVRCGQCVYCAEFGKREEGRIRYCMALGTNVMASFYCAAGKKEADK